MLMQRAAKVAVVAMENKTTRIVGSVLVSGRLYSHEPPITAA